MNTSDKIKILKEAKSNLIIAEVKNKEVSQIEGVEFDKIYTIFHNYEKFKHNEKLIFNLWNFATNKEKIDILTQEIKNLEDWQKRYDKIQ